MRMFLRRVGSKLGNEMHPSFQHFDLFSHTHAWKPSMMWALCPSGMVKGSEHMLSFRGTFYFGPHAIYWSMYKVSFFMTRGFNTYIVVWACILLTWRGDPKLQGGTWPRVIMLILGERAFFPPHWFVSALHNNITCVCALSISIFHFAHMLGIRQRTTWPGA